MTEKPQNKKTDSHTSQKPKKDNNVKASKATKDSRNSKSKTEKPQKKAKNKRIYKSLVVNQGSDEIEWLRNQNNESKSLRFAIAMCIRFFGKQDVFDAMTDSVLNVLHSSRDQIKPMIMQMNTSNTSSASGTSASTQEQVQPQSQTPAINTAPQAPADRPKKKADPNTKAFDNFFKNKYGNSKPADSN